MFTRIAAARSLLLFAAVMTFAARAQVPGLPMEGQKPVSPALNWASAPVEVNGIVLFRRYARDTESARLRADVARLRLANVVREMGDGAAPEVQVNPDGKPPVEIVIKDQVVLTVTDADAQATGMDAAQLGETWAREIRRALAEAQKERMPDFTRRAAMAAIGWLVFGVILQIGMVWIRRRWLCDTGLAAVILLWSYVAGHILVLHPTTRPIYNFLVHGPLRPFTILVLSLLAALALARSWSSILRNVFPTDPEDLTAEERAERAYRRRTTLVGVARITGVAAIWMVATLAALSWAGVNLPALIASAGLLGVGVGLAAQDSMKDIVAGVNILMDDRYGVGDVIDVNGYSGTVERLNLRITQIRNTSGHLITIPNREVVVVANQTSRWAQVDMRVGVAYDTDLERAMQVLLDTAKGLYNDWPAQILEEPKLQGVDAFEPSAIILRIYVRTAPGDQWRVGRELRLRLKRAFDRDGIRIPLPQQEVCLRENDNAK